MSRYILGLCVFALFAAVLVNAQEVDFEGEDEDQLRGGYLKIAVSLLKKAFAKVEKDCIYEAIDRCGFNVLHPKRLVKCGTSYFKENKDKCFK